MPPGPGLSSPVGCSFARYRCRTTTLQNAVLHQIRCQLRGSRIDSATILERSSTDDDVASLEKKGYVLPKKQKQKKQALRGHLTISEPSSRSLASVVVHKFSFQVTDCPLQRFLPSTNWCRQLLTFELGCGGQQDVLVGRPHASIVRG